MRPFELLLSILTFFTALTLFRTRPPQLAWLFCALTLSLLTLHILREGPHWQLASLYAALILVAIFLFRPNPHPWIAGAAITLTAASLALSWALPLFHLPAPTGPYAIGTRTLHLTDPTTHRELVTNSGIPQKPPASLLHTSTPLRSNRSSATWLSSAQTLIRTPQSPVKSSLFSSSIQAGPAAAPRTPSSSKTSPATATS